MLHSPIPVDRELSGESAQPLEEELESLGFDSASERLREAHLHNGQVRARALFAPFLGVTSVAAALIAAWSMYQSIRHDLVIGWVALVAFANWVSARRAMADAAWGSSRNAKQRASGLTIAEAVGLAGLWASLPT